jgi:hypothetical protein
VNDADNAMGLVEIWIPKRLYLILRPTITMAK